MRRNEIILAIIFVVSVVGAGLLAHVLHKQRADFSEARGRIHKMPIAGFQKFMADVVWMRFLYYAGGNQLDETTADEYNSFIRLIIALDPDFYRAYYEGALMLGPVAPEKALEIVNLGDEHPRIRREWKLQMMGGQIIMRKQWHNHYSNKEMDTDEIARAHVYFRRAKDLPNCMQSALNSFIRTKALTATNGEPREMNELREWHNYWKNTRFAYEDFAEGGAMDASMAGAYEGGGEFYADSDAITQRIIGQIKKLAQKYVKAKDVKPEEKDNAKALINKVITDIFPSRQFDVESFIPYQTENAVMYRGTIESPKSKSYMVELDSPDSYAIGLLTARCSGGTVKMTVLIDGNEVDGLTNVAVSDTKVEYPGLIETKVVEEEEKPDKGGGEKILDLPESTKPVTTTPVLIRKPLRANKGKKGSIIEIRISDAVDAKDVSYILKVYPGEYF